MFVTQQAAAPCRYVFGKSSAVRQFGDSLGFNSGNGGKLLFPLCGLCSVKRRSQAAGSEEATFIFSESISEKDAVYQVTFSSGLYRDFLIYHFSFLIAIYGSAETESPQEVR